MATIIQCKFCNMPFQSLGGKLCNNCLDQIDLDFAAIRDYLYEHPGSVNIDKICEETEIKKRVILYLIDEKRLTFSTPEGGVFSCSICHKPIPEGNMCDDCKNTLSQTLGAAVLPPKTKQPEKKKNAIRSKSERMHLRNDDK